MVSLSFWDVHVVRTPVAGIVTNIEMEGSYLDELPGPEQVREMMFLRGKAAPVQVIITLATAQGEVRIRMITSYWASRLKVWVGPGTVLAKGDRIGRIVLGSTVVAEFPGQAEFRCDAGPACAGRRNRHRALGAGTMIWIDGRFSWPLVLTIVYATLVIIVTDTVWRLVVRRRYRRDCRQRPGRDGLGVAVIVFFAARINKRRAAQSAAGAMPSVL